METPQANDTSATTVETTSETPAAPVNHEAKGIEAVAAALSSAFAGIEAGETKNETVTPAGEETSNTDIDALLAEFEKSEQPAPKADEKGEADENGDPFKKIADDWDPDLAALLKAQAEEIKTLKAQVKGGKSEAPASAGPTPLETYISDLIPKNHALATAANLPRVAKLVDRSASVVAQALIAARPPKNGDEAAAIEREAIGIVVGRLTNQAKPARAERAAPAKTIPPGGSASGPSAHRSAPSHMDKGVAAIAEAMRTLG